MHEIRTHEITATRASLFLTSPSPSLRKKAGGKEHKSGPGPDCDHHYLQALEKGGHLSLKNPCQPELKNHSMCTPLVCEGNRGDPQLCRI